MYVSLDNLKNKLRKIRAMSIKELNYLTILNDLEIFLKNFYSDIF